MESQDDVGLWNGVSQRDDEREHGVDEEQKWEVETGAEAAAVSPCHRQNENGAVTVFLKPHPKRIGHQMWHTWHTIHTCETCHTFHMCHTCRGALSFVSLDVNLIPNVSMPDPTQRWTAPQPTTLRAPP